jgi:hypothetical protein
MIPGEIRFASGDIDMNVGRATVSMEVANSGDRPIQVGSHYHFAEANDACVRPRCRTRFPAEYRPRHGGAFRAGPDPDGRTGGAGWRTPRIRLSGPGDGGLMKISRQAYAEMFGPTTGDRGAPGRHRPVGTGRADFTVYGEEVKFGGGKVIRDGMGQARAWPPRWPTP